LVFPHYSRELDLKVRGTHQSAKTAGSVLPALVAPSLDDVYRNVSKLTLHRINLQTSSSLPHKRSFTEKDSYTGGMSIDTVTDLPPSQPMNSASLLTAIRSGETRVQRISRLSGSPGSDWAQYRTPCDSEGGTVR
jgi:hypothetical protein